MSRIIEIRRAIARAQDRMTALHGASEREKRDLSATEQSEWADLRDEVRTLKAELREEERLEAENMSGSSSDSGASNGQRYSGFRTSHATLGEFIADVRWDARSLSAGVGAKGGFLIPDQLIDRVLARPLESGIVLPRATILQPESDAHPDAAVEIPALDGDGLTAQWISEGDLKPETSVDLRQIRLEPEELAGHVVVTDKLLRNSRAISTFLERSARDALTGAQDQAFLTGSGTGQPLGVLNAPGALDVARASAGTVTYPDLAAMLAKLTPESSSRATWVISQSVMADLLTMTDQNSNQIWQPNARDASPGTILGMTAYFTGRVPPAGTRGDVMLIDWSYYLVRLGSGPFVLASDAPLFRENKTILKFFTNVDGQPWVTAPFVLEDTVTSVSPFVILD